MKYEAKIFLQSAGAPVTVIAEADCASNAKRVIDAQYNPKSYFTYPHPVK